MTSAYARSGETAIPTTPVNAVEVPVPSAYAAFELVSVESETAELESDATLNQT